MVGKVPGLLELQAGPPVELTAPMAKGYDMGVVVLVDYVETLATFFTHPSHDEVHELYMQVCEQGGTIGYDIEF
uniref:StcH n=1 Tax=Aspergillus ochraceoroseus TaxID=138278 RepID=B5DCJ1_9EURO|nr:StcH [Aspergillus ochraceoroseus]